MSMHKPGTNIPNQQLQQAGKPLSPPYKNNERNHWEKREQREICSHRDEKEKTHLDEFASSMVINPIPTVNTANATHITGRYLPVLDTKIPESAEKAAHPSENGNILVQTKKKKKEVYHDQYILSLEIRIREADG